MWHLPLPEAHPEARDAGLQQIWETAFKRRSCPVLASRLVIYIFLPTHRLFPRWRWRSSTADNTLLAALIFQIQHRGIPSLKAMQYIGILSPRPKAHKLLVYATMNLFVGCWDNQEINTKELNFGSLFGRRGQGMPLTAFSSQFRLLLPSLSPQIKCESLLRFLQGSRS